MEQLLYEALLGHHSRRKKVQVSHTLVFMVSAPKGHTSHISIPPIFQWLKQVMGQFLSSEGQGCIILP